jgi:GDSL-like Lipase/Acylhydrolase family
MRSCAAVVLALLVAAVAPGVARGADWVGLGDSYAAGPLIPSQSLSPLGCLRSSRNFAHIAATNRGMSLADVSCSGAKTDNMLGSQSTSAGTNAPQFNALSAATKVVTLQIGGNDIGFTEILQNCVTYNPFTHPCQDRYGTGANDQINARIAATAPKVAAAIQGIHQRSPSAKVLVVNYAAILPDTGSGCWPQVPLADGSGRQRRDLRRRLLGLDRQGRVPVGRNALGRAAGAGQRGRAVPPQRPRDGGRRGAGHGGVELAALAGGRVTPPT